MITAWSWAGQQRFLTVTLTQHEALIVYESLDGTKNLIVKELEQDLQKFYEKGVL